MRIKLKNNYGFLLPSTLELLPAFQGPFRISFKGRSPLQN